MGSTRSGGEAGHVTLYQIELALEQYNIQLLFVLSQQQLNLFLNSVSPR
jgi:hypothetical protein